MPQSLFQMDDYWFLEWTVFVSFSLSPNLDFLTHMTDEMLSFPLYKILSDYSEYPQQRQKVT